MVVREDSPASRPDGGIGSHTFSSAVAVGYAQIDWSTTLERYMAALGEMPYAVAVTGSHDGCVFREPFIPSSARADFLPVDVDAFGCFDPNTHPRSTVTSSPGCDRRCIDGSGLSGSAHFMMSLKGR
jgi:hypothetical protein